MTSESKLTLDPQTLDDADPTAKTILEKTKAQFGLVPNMYAVMANSPGLLTTYADGYDRFRNAFAKDLGVQLAREGGDRGGWTKP